MAPGAFPAENEYVFGPILLACMVGVPQGCWAWRKVVDPNKKRNNKPIGPNGINGVGM